MYETWQSLQHVHTLAPRGAAGASRSALLFRFVECTHHFSWPPSSATHRWVMSNVNVTWLRTHSRVTSCDMTHSWLIVTSCDMTQLDITQRSNVNESCHTWVSPVTWVGHVIYDWVTSRMSESRHVWVSHVAHQWVTSLGDEACKPRVRRKDAYCIMKTNT